MSKQDKQEINNQQSQIADLPVNEDRAAEVKGGSQDVLGMNTFHSLLFEGERIDR